MAMKQLRNNVIRASLDALYYTGAHHVLRPLLAGVGTIFMLHHVRPARDDMFQPNRHLEITPDFLREVLAHVRALGVDIVSMDEAHRRMHERDFARRFACFTFDDGYRDNRDHALPLFREFDVPCTVYVASDFAEGTGRLWWIELERALELAPGHLSRLLEDARSARSLQKLEGRARTLPLSGLATNLAQSLGLSFATTLRNVSVHCRLFVSSERIEVREEVRLVLTAHRADNQAYPVVQRQLTESRITPRVVAGTGFTLGRTVAVPERQLLLAELLPMRQLEPGENLMAEYTVHWAPVQVPTTAHERSSTRGFRELVLQVDFDPAAVPRTVSYRSRANNDEPVPDTGITVPIVDGVAQFVRLNVPPGVHGLYWSWD